MSQIYDEKGNLIQNKLFLAYPNKEHIDIISGVEEYRPIYRFASNGMNEISFKVHKYSNGVINKLFDKIEAKLLVEVQFMGWFQIQSAEEKGDGLDIYKEVQLYSYENILVGKRIEAIDGVFALYDITDVDNSVLHLCAKYSGWKVGHVDNELISKFRTFSVDSNNIYSFLTKDVADSFKCLIKFDTYSETINAYLPEHLGEDTNIFISNRNLLTSYSRTADADKIVTKLKVKGGDGLDIRNINPDGSNALINLNYYLPMMSESLRNAWLAYITKYNNYLTNFNNLVTSWKNKIAQRITLESELRNLEIAKNTQDEIVRLYVSVNKGVPTGTSDYQSYLTALNLSNSYVTQIALKTAVINAKINEINIAKNLIDNYQTDLTEGNFTQAQYSELEMFLTEGDVYEDSTFTVTDIMTDEEVIDMQIELRNNASIELETSSRPQWETKIEASNLYSIVDDVSRKLSYDEWKQQLQVGNFITVKLHEDYWATLRVLEIELDYSDPSHMGLVLSTKSKSSSYKEQMDELLNNASTVSNIVSLAKYGWDQASKINSEVRTLMNGAFDATLNIMRSSPNEEFIITPYGAMMKSWLPNENRYSDYQSWWTGSTLLFSSDGFKSSKTGIGLFTSGNNTFYGVIADVVIGQLLLGEKLTISNTSGTYTINNNGFTATNGVYSVGINPNTPAEIINVKINGVSQLYVNTVAKKLVYDGSFTANAISTMNLVVGENVTMGANATINWSQINGANTNVTTITRDTVTTSFVNALNITANTVSSNWIYAGVINASQISAGTISGDRISGGTITGTSISTTGIEISGNNIQLTRGFGKIVDSSSRTLLYADSSGNISISDVGSPTSNLNLYSTNLQLYYNKLAATTSSSSGSITLNVFGSGGLAVTSSSTNLTSNTAVGLQAPTLNITGSGTTNITGSTNINLIGTNINFRKNSSSTNYSIYDLAQPNAIYADSLYYVSLSSGRELIPNIPSTSSTGCSIGNSTYPWKNVYVQYNFYHTSSSGAIGFFGTSPTSKKSVSKISSTSSATSSSNATKINDILTALAAYGLLSSS